MQILTDIKLNMKSPNWNTIVHAKQNDRLTRAITAELLNGEQAWNPPDSGVIYAVRYTKADGTRGFYESDEAGNQAVSVVNNIATIILAEQALTAPGPVAVEVNLYTSSGEKLTSFKFCVMVEESSLTDEEIISTDYFNVLTQQITEVIGKINSVAGITAEADGIPSGEQTHVAVTGGTGSDDPYNLHFYVEQGLDGATFVPRGDYSSSATYDKLDIVSYNNVAYVAMHDGITGIAPDESDDDWQKISSQVYVVSSTLSYVLENSSDFSGNPPSTGWQTTVPQAQGNSYLWIRTKNTWSDGSEFYYYVASRNGADAEGSPGSLLPLMDGTATAGAANSYSREDHVHPSDTTKLDIQQDAGDAGKFLVVGDDGAITTLEISEWQGGSF